MTTSPWRQLLSKVRTLVRGPKEKSKQRNRSRLRRLRVEELEERIVPTGDLPYQAVDATPLTLRLLGADLQVVNTNNPSQVLASKPLLDITTGVHIDGAGFDVNLTIDASVPTTVGGGILFDGGTGTNTLIGPGPDTIWHVTGAGSGDVGGPLFVRFTSVETLVQRPASAGQTMYLDVDGDRKSVV